MLDLVEVPVLAAALEQVPEVVAPPLVEVQEVPEPVAQVQPPAPEGEQQLYVKPLVPDELKEPRAKSS